MISDGSFFSTKSQAAGAWILGNEARHRTITGKFPCAGNKHHHSAYRAELTGLYGGLLFVKLLCTCKEITNGKIIIGCDGPIALLMKSDTCHPCLQSILIISAPSIPC